MANTPWKDLLKTAEEGGGVGELLPPGEYNVIVSDAKTGTSQNGKARYTLVWQVTDGPLNGRKVFHDMYLSPESPQAMSIFFRQMGAIGLTAEFFRGEPSDEQIVSALKNRTARITLAHRQNNGRTYHDIKKIHEVRATAPATAAAAPAPAPAPAPAAVGASTGEGDPF